MANKITRNWQGLFEIPDNTVVAVADYFALNRARIEDIYSWQVPLNAPAGFEVRKGQTAYEQNVELKNFLRAAWEQGDTARRKELAKWVVRDWGGIRSGKPDRIDRYVEQILNGEFETKFYGIASYSKILGAINPDRYAIYDARVAVSLTALQIINRTTEGAAFNVPPGRNKIVGDAIHKRGFSQEPRFKPRALVKEKGWFRIQRDDTYEVYSRLLDLVLSVLPDEKLYRLEMLLFADAEKLALEANAVA